MGDDVEAPHEMVVWVDAELKPYDLIQKIVKENYLAFISGGKATWIVDLDGHLLGVVAQQWTFPRFNSNEPENLKSSRHLHFRYHAQESPEEVFSRI